MNQHWIPRICFFLAAWKRPDITEICFKGIRRLIDYANGYTGMAFCVISEPYMRPKAEKYGIKTFMYSNDYLGQKKNAGLSEAMKHEWDFMVELGSDDILSNQYMDLMMKQIHNGMHYVAIQEHNFVNKYTGEVKHVWHPSWPGAFGVGRMFSREILVKNAIGYDVRFLKNYTSGGGIFRKNLRITLEHKKAHDLVNRGIIEIIRGPSVCLWDTHINSGLDTSSNRFLHSKQVFATLMGYPDAPVTVGIKSDVNIHSFEKFDGKPRDLEWIKPYIPEYDDIKSLIEKWRTK